MPLFDILLPLHLHSKNNLILVSVVLIFNITTIVVCKYYIENNNRVGGSFAHGLFECGEDNSFQIFCFAKRHLLKQLELKRGKNWVLVCR